MARIKKKEHEKLSASNIENVIYLLNPEAGKPISKKDACSILNISYNTVRLAKIIEEYNSKKAYVAERKAMNKGKHATKEEITQAITEYLRGDTVADIAKGLFRSAGFVKALIERIGVPQRPTSTEARKGIDLIPEECVAEDFEKGQLVWSAKYHTTAVVKDEVTLEQQDLNQGVKPVDYEQKYGAKCYKIDIIEAVNASESFFPYVQKGGFFAYALGYDLGNLSHLEEYGVDLSRV